MKEREPLVVGSLVALLLLVWLGFLAHTAPMFAGSAWGGVLGVSGALLILASFAYVAIKRIPFLKRKVTARIPLATVLDWHVYTGLLGALLGMLHTGHKFESPLGIVLTASILVVTLSGFVGRHLLKKVSLTLGEKKKYLTDLELAYRQTAGEVAARRAEGALFARWTGLGAGLAVLFFTRAGAVRSSSPLLRAISLAEAIADVEFSIKSHEFLKRLFALWLAFHISAGIAVIVFLGLHVWAGLHFGLRWFS